MKGRKKRGGGFDSAGSVLESMVRGNRHLSPSAPRRDGRTGGVAFLALVDLVRLSDRWETVMGGATARHSEPERLAGGTLHVVVSSPPLLHQCRLLKGHVVRNAAAVLGPGVVKDVRFRVGAVRRREAPPVREEKPPPQEEERESLAKAADEILARIGDPALRKLMRSVYVESAIEEKKVADENAESGDDR